MKLIEFSKIAGRLKRLKRTGWVRSGVQNPESVAEHSFRTALLSLVLSKRFNVDESKVVKMALIHDLGEAEIGDIVTKRGKKILPELAEKISAEKTALFNILQLVEREELIKLFEEFVAQETPEARLVKQLDKFEMGIQAVEYEEEQGINLEEFIEDIKDSLHGDFFAGFIDEIEKNRNKS